MLLVIPAIDLRAGRCVRLRSGRYEDESVYFDDPLKMAKLWRVQNARVLHLKDVDAEDRPKEDAVDNRTVIYEIATALDIPVEVAGGVRTLDDVEALLAVGVYRVVLSTQAARDADLVEEAIRRHTCSRVVVGIDAFEGQVRADGKNGAAALDAIDLALEMERCGVRRIVYTDVVEQGVLPGPNVEAIRALGRHLTKARITVAGGVGGYRDLLRLQELTSLGVDSVIIGRALYENRFPCQQFWCWNRKEVVDLDTYSTARLASAIDRCD
jgi:phosphoribosylformimino-5-aminoimidazole carboxamide ribotide isomerase